jgi:hypothetical protein
VSPEQLAAQIDKHAFNEIFRQVIRAGAKYPETRVLSLERTAGRWRIDTTPARSIPSGSPTPPAALPRSHANWARGESRSIA